MLKKALLFLLKCYQVLISPYMGNCCRFFPSCSDYAKEALEKRGVFRGLYLTVRRLLRCHPFHRGGHDPVP